jgi:hypothetical protein
LQSLSADSPLTKGSRNEREVGTNRARNGNETQHTDFYRYIGGISCGDNDKAISILAGLYGWPYIEPALAGIVGFWLDFYSYPAEIKVKTANSLISSIGLTIQKVTTNV